MAAKLRSAFSYMLTALFVLAIGLVIAPHDTTVILDHLARLGEIPHAIAKAWHATGIKLH